MTEVWRTSLTAKPLAPSVYPASIAGITHLKHGFVGPKATGCKDDRLRR